MKISHKVYVIPEHILGKIFECAKSYAKISDGGFANISFMNDMERLIKDNTIVPVNIEFDLGAK